jgi:hypothetical protein
VPFLSVSICHHARYHESMVATKCKHNEVKIISEVAFLFLYLTFSQNY